MNASSSRNNDVFWNVEQEEEEEEKKLRAQRWDDAGTLVCRSGFWLISPSPLLPVYKTVYLIHPVLSSTLYRGGTPKNFLEFFRTF